jgi:mevalonate kinase
LLNGEFYSKGKLLLTGEYLVLYGAKALAVPLKFGQAMNVRDLQRPGFLIWETYVMGKLWFTVTFKLNDLEILYSSNQETARFVQSLLVAGSKHQPELLTTTEGYLIQNYLDFDINWGLGSSSSLVSNLAWWLEISPFTLYRELYHGSGYDVICARSEKPILYQLKRDLPVFREINFKPAFSDQVYFVYLGRKQDSQKSVTYFKSLQNPDGKITGEISDLTDSMLNAGSFDEFLKVMRHHEEIIASVLALTRVKEELFPDFPGEVKSLGAWGGDFVMAASHASHDEIIDYFSRKNLPVVFPWKDIVLEIRN